MSLNPRQVHTQLWLKLASATCVHPAAWVHLLPAALTLGSGLAPVLSQTTQATACGHTSDTTSAPPYM
jgi:hypothetical protein